MELPYYEYKTSKALFDYEFYSEGPKGLIKKAVRFSLITFLSFACYNIGFGDWNEEQSGIDDFIVSNNLDAEKVLTTMAQIIIDFTNRFPAAIIHIKGSTPARTRRYQMGINKYWREIEPVFEVYALIENQGFFPFKPDRNYNAFIIKRKDQ